MRFAVDFLHYLFVPKHTNNYTAKLLHHDFLTIYLIVALILGAGIRHIQNTSNILGYATDVTVEKLLDITNQKRADNNLEALNYNEELSEAAQTKAEDMFAKNYWSHYGPDGETPWEFILSSGYQYEYAGENLAKNFMMSDNVVQAWMNSPTHRDNLLRKDYTDVGFAVINGLLNGEETTLVVQMFAKPLYAPVQAEADRAPVEQVAQYAPEKTPQSSEVLANDTPKKQVSFFENYFNINILFFAILALALFLDFYFAAKLNIIRVKGKNLAHLFFIGFIVAGAYIVIHGSII